MFFSRILISPEGDAEGHLATLADIARLVMDEQVRGQLIEAAAAISQPLLKPGVILNLDIAPGLPEIVSDQDKIKQILLNLHHRGATGADETTGDGAGILFQIPHEFWQI